MARRPGGEPSLRSNKRRRIAKAMWFDGSEWCLLAKRLEAGSFQLPAVDSAQAQATAK